MGKSKPLLADRLKTLVMLQRPKTAVAHEDTAGHIDLTLDANWIDAGKRWAEVKTLTGREFDQDSQQRATQTHKVSFRYDSLTRTIGATWRLRWTAPGNIVRTLYVNAPAADLHEAHNEIVCKCGEARA
jgi:head-tail adaptor